MPDVNSIIDNTPTEDILEFEGYGTFLEFSDRELRTRNQAVVMGNITEFNTSPEGITDKGRYLLTTYFGLVPEEDRAMVWVKYYEYVKEVLKLDIQSVLQVAKE